MNTHHYPTRSPIKAAVQVLLVLLALFMSSCTGGSAPSLDSSAQAWVEYPFEGSTLPTMDSITLIVYAADPVGINYIDIKINGQSLPAYAPSPITQDGSPRLVRIDLPWQPPAEGEYVLEAIGVNTAGGSGGTSSTRFCVVTCEPETTTISTPTPTPAFTDTPLPFITLPPGEPTYTPTWTPPADTAEEIVVEFYASPPYVDAGNCSTLHWEVTGSQTVYLNSASVYTIGSEEHCPCETESNNLQVVKPGGSTDDHWVTIDVYGNCSTPATDPPPTDPPVPSDTTGPTINAVYTFWQSCDLYGQADISDPSGVAWAEFWFDLNGQGWAWIQMNESGGLWTSQVGISVSDGISTPSGSLVYKVRTLDTLHNESWSGETTFPYTGCGGLQ